jgi:hypothetical protein
MAMIALIGLAGVLCAASPPNFVVFFADDMGIQNHYLHDLK